MPIFGRWRAERQLQERAERFVARLLEDPDAAQVDWLASAATRGDRDHALWELRYARRALGLVSAQRDALDDRTGATVAHAMAAAFERDRNIGRDRLELAQRQFNARLSAYRDAVGARVTAATPGRLGRTLLAFAGGSFRDLDPTVERAGALLAADLGAANEALREIFGTATLPEHVPPSAIGR
ncbi:MAG: hypothetical protein KGL38_01495 [Gemmatimonadota bacterium]|nr:hypothetical protein [Gemmatimonadota bacterium]MDE3126644.1 hypothetical protein [Gemmatimonadota bacterium]MDE3173610.1 hypothetical protein [Gemmatimonadota bacterium]MDE3217425.1 hypothetical protein [Gemmatimonadota bacterium]